MTCTRFVVLIRKPAELMFTQRHPEEPNMKGCHQRAKAGSMHAARHPHVQLDRSNSTQPKPNPQCKINPHSQRPPSNDQRHRRSPSRHVPTMHRRTVCLPSSPTTTPCHGQQGRIHNMRRGGDFFNLLSFLSFASSFSFSFSSSYVWLKLLEAGGSCGGSNGVHGVGALAPTLDLP